MPRVLTGAKSSVCLQRYLGIAGCIAPGAHAGSSGIASEQRTCLPLGVLKWTYRSRSGLRSHNRPQKPQTLPSSHYRILHALLHLTACNKRTRAKVMTVWPALPNSVTGYWPRPLLVRLPVSTCLRSAHASEVQQLQREVQLDGQVSQS